MTFKLTIELGNDAMQTFGDVAEALNDVAEKLNMMPLEECGSADPYDRAGKIRGANGNTVGAWEVK